jgi:hypothetical protein
MISSAEAPIGHAAAARLKPRRRISLSDIRALEK